MSLADFEAVSVVISSIVTPTLGVLGFLELHRKNKEIGANIEIVRHETNSMKDELVNEVRVASLAKGRLDKETEIARNA
jgi:hypothetical protein